MEIKLFNMKLSLAPPCIVDGEKDLEELVLRERQRNVNH
jgi:hypothetical protein